MMTERIIEKNDMIINNEDPFQMTYCYLYKTKKAAKSMTDYYDRMFAAAGVTASQFVLIMHISKGERCSVRELADRVRLDRSTLARSLKPLYRKGLVVDVSEPGTRKSALELTRKGKESLALAKQRWLEAQDQVRNIFGPDDLDMLDHVLEKLWTVKNIPV